MAWYLGWLTSSLGTRSSTVSSFIVSSTGIDRDTRVLGRQSLVGYLGVCVCKSKLGSVDSRSDLVELQLSGIGLVELT